MTTSRFALLDSMRDADWYAAVAAFERRTRKPATARAWTKDGINVTRRTYLLTPASPRYLMFWTSVDTTLRSDFFFDNVRLIATVCK